MDMAAGPPTVAASERNGIPDRERRGGGAGEGAERAGMGVVSPKEKLEMPRDGVARASAGGGYAGSLPFPLGRKKFVKSSHTVILRQSCTVL
jgi:hypothetical protein